MVIWIWIEKILFYLIALDCLTYFVMTLSTRWHDGRYHHFWKTIPLDWRFAVYYLALIFWIGFALFRLGILF